MTSYKILTDRTISVIANNGWEGKPGEDAGFGQPSASASTLQPGSQATVSINASGPDTAKVFDFSFGIPAGLPGKDGVDGKDGIDGQDGRDGIDGQAATITVGSTSTLPAGSSATVTNSGTSSQAVFNFGIPAGEAGQAATVQASAQTVSYDTPASVINTGTPQDAHFVFHIPQGQPGSDGAPGQAAGFGTPTATASTLTPGSSATVSVSASGADTAKVFDFTFGIPQGAEGQQGPAGYTPVRGTDYWTAADQAQIVSDTLAQLPDTWTYSQVKTEVSSTVDSYLITGVKKNNTLIPYTTEIYAQVQMLGADGNSEFRPYSSQAMRLYTAGQIPMRKSNIDTIIQTYKPDCVECEIIFFDTASPDNATTPLFRTLYPVTAYVDSQIGNINTILQSI